MILGVDFSDVPDKILPIQNGTYVWDILTCVVEDAKNDDNDPKKVGNKNVVVKLKLNQDGHPDHGRTQTDYIFLGNDMANIPQFSKVKLKNLYQSATGQVPGVNGYDPAELVGKQTKAEVETQSYKDAKSGQTRESTRIKEYKISA